MVIRSRTEYSLLNIFVGLGGYIINTVLGFVCRIVFVRCLSADYLGVNGLFSNILTMLSLAELGIGSAIVYALYKPLAEHDEEKVASLVSLFGKAYRSIGLIIFIIGILLTPFIKIIIKEVPELSESIYLLYIINLFNTASTYFFSYRSSLLTAAQQNYLVIGINYIITVLQSALQMIWLLNTHNYLGYILIQTIGTFVYNFTISKIAIKNFPYLKFKNHTRISKEEVRELQNNVRDLTIYKISGLLVNSTDNILITFFKGLAITGIASNYTLLVNTLNSFLSQIFNSITASIGNHNVTEDLSKRVAMFNFMNLMNFWIFGWASLGIVFFSSDIVSLCFGQTYVLPLRIPIVMALNFYTVGMMNAIWTYKHTLGLFRFGRFLQILTGILNITLSIIMGEFWGLFGIFFATFVARALTNLWYDPYAVFKHGFNLSPSLYLKRYVSYFVVLLFAASACFFLLRPFQGTHLSILFVKILICSIVTNLTFFLFFHRTKEFFMLRTIVSTVFFKFKHNS